MKTISFKILTFLTLSLGPASLVWAANNLTGAVGTLTLIAGRPAKTTGVDVADIDQDGILTYTDPLQLNGAKKFFYLSHRPVQKIEVKLNDVILSSQDLTLKCNYAVHAKNGWITLKNVYSATNTIKVSYEYSTDLDVAAANDDDESAMIYRNDGNFNFYEIGPLPGGPTRSQDGALADLNGDLYPDLVLANKTTPSQFLLNNAGSFLTSTPTSLDTLTLNSYRVVLGDFNGDNFMDIAEANSNGNQSKIYKNDGTGNFTEVWNNGGGGDARSIDFGDFDNDGDLDLLIGNYQGKMELWKNQDPPGPALFITDENQDKVYKMDPNTLVVSVAKKAYNPGNGHSFADPYGVAVDDDYVYVANTHNQTVVKLKKSDLTFVQEVGTYGFAGPPPLMFHDPYDISLDDTYLYVLDKGNQQVRKFLKSNLTEVGVPFASDIMQGSAIDSQYLYLTDASSTGKLLKWDIANYSVVTSVPYGLLGINIGAGGIEADSTNVFVADTANNRVLKMDKNFNQQGAPVGSGAACQDSFIGAPWGLGVDKTYLYIADNTCDRIVKYKKSDMSFVSKSMGGGLDGTRGVAFDYGATRKWVKVWDSPEDIPVQDLQWVDVDKDGDLDIVVANDNSSSGLNKANVIYRNDFPAVDGTGKPIFTKTWEASTLASSNGVAVGDVDADGYQDLVFSNNSDVAAVEYFLNNKDGTFTRAWGSDADPIPQYNDLLGTHLILANMNADDKLDVVSAAFFSLSHMGGFNGIEIFKNVDTSRKFVKVTSVSTDGKRKTTITTYFKVNADGTLGKVVATEIN